MAKDAQRDGGVGFDAVARAEALYIYQHAYPTHMEQPPAALRGGANAPPDEAAAAQPNAHAERVRQAGPDASIRALLLQRDMPSVDGLSFSGGGIRSASFCLGVLETLARAGLLARMHYVSSVSGGGYIAGWLASWCYRDAEGITGVQKALRDAARSDAAPAPIQHLLRYVTYLAPRAGFLAVDLWSLISACARNLIVTLGITLPVLLVLAAVPYIAALTLQVMARAPLMVHLAGWCVLASVVLVAMTFRVLAEASTPRQAAFKAGLARTLAVALTVGGGAALAVVLAAGGLAPWLAQQVPALGLPHSGQIAAAAALPVLVLLLRDVRNKLAPRATADHAIASSLAMVAVLWLLVGLDMASQQLARMLDGRGALEISIAVASASPALWCLVVFGGETLRQALLSRQLDDSDREWMARFVANTLTASAAWWLLCVATYAVPQMIRLSGVLWFAAGFVVCLVLVRRWMPAQFAALAVAAASALSLVVAGEAVLAFLEAYPAGAGSDLTRLLLVCVALVVLALVIDNFVDVNRFSLHALDRDRLVRAFLGASRGVDPRVGESGLAPHAEREQFALRRGSPFHDFDAGDSPRMRALRSDAVWRRAHWMPVFLFNTSLNRTWHSSEPGRLVKAFSFVLSPFYCGSRVTQYCPTEEYVKDEGGLSLGTAIATSGAALSSRTGRYDSHPLAFFLTLFNLRLGWWLGNPGSRSTRSHGGPRFSLGSYLAEMLGRPYGQRKWVHLSDGGHFENLGAFELIKRGCRRVVVVDGSADPRRQFADLANLIRLVREELNIGIEPMSGFRIGNRDLGDKGRYCALFEVKYPEGQSGRLLYIKAAYYPVSAFNVPMEVQNYAMEQPEFPHEPTMDQFFTPAQFDAYRRLGQHQMSSILARGREEGYSVSDLMAAASDHIGDAVAR